MLKKYKQARFKAFSFYHEAEAFALHGYECSTRDAINKSESGNGVVGEKPSQFRAPKWQDLVKLRKMIEAGDVHYVSSAIWENPRYLVSLGDTPSILQVSHIIYIPTNCMNFYFNRKVAVIMHCMWPQGHTMQRCVN